MGFSLAVVSGAYSLVAVYGLLIKVASLTVVVQWNPPGPGSKPMSPALAGRFFTTESPWKSYLTF